MKKFKKVILSILSLALVAILSIGGTIAYLTSEDSDVNVMTMGNVKIAQHEYERVQNADGSYEMVKSDKYGEGYKLQEFTQAKPLYPATGSVTGWGNAVYFDQLSNKASGGQKVLAGLENVQDKFVLVENTGRSDAYVRTIIAYEIGSLTEEKFDEIIYTNVNGNWTYTNIGTATIDDSNYFIVEALYTGNESRHTNGVLPAGEYTYNSLAQVYLKNEATSEDVEAIDGNGNGTYDILVFSQAIQTKGFDNAEDALDTGFGDITTTNHPWINGVAIGVTVNTEEELLNAIKAGNDIVLGKDIELKEPETIINKDLTLYLNGKTLTSYRNHRSGLTTKDVTTLTIDGANVVIKGDGKVLNIGDNTAYAVAVTNHGKVTIDGGYYQAFHDTFYVKQGTLEILAGKFNTIGDDTPYAVEDLEQHTNTYADCFSNSVINCDDDQYTTGNAHVIVKGGSFRNFNPSNVHEGRFHHQNHVASGYKVVASELDENNDVWYTVVAE